MGVPFDIIDVENELNKKLLADFTGERSHFVQVGPKKYFMPSGYRKQAAEIYNFKVKPEDVWICTYPRSGTTVMQEMLWVIVNDLDFKSAAGTALSLRAPFIEDSVLVHEGFEKDLMDRVRGDPVKEEAARKFVANMVPVLNAAPSPRVIKTHLPFSLLPPSLVNKSKAVYMVRNPRDMVASYYHHNRMVRVIGYESDFPTFWEYFERDLLIWSPYWEHVREAWLLKDHPNVLFLFYEDLVKDPKAMIRQVAKFLGKTLDESQVEQVAQHVHIDNFRKNKTVNAHVDGLPGVRAEGEDFIRKGQIGSWKAEFTPEMTTRAEKWIEENLASIPGLVFPQ